MTYLAVPRPRLIRLAVLLLAGASFVFLSDNFGSRTTATADTHPRPSKRTSHRQRERRSIPDGTQSNSLAPPSAELTKQRLSEWFKLPLYFVENRGQVDRQVAYYLQGRDTAVYFTAQGITFSLTGQGERPEAIRAFEQRAAWRPALFGGAADQAGAKQRWAVKLDFIGANPGVRPVGQDSTPAVISYFKGRQDQWQAGLKTYAALAYRDLWPGIDLVYSGAGNQLKYTFLVKPGADPHQIKLAYRGATSVKLNAAGQLEVTTPVGGFHDQEPYAYQETNGKRLEVTAAYCLEADPSTGTQSYGFRVGDYDQSRPLVLDPAVLIYAGLIGGAGNEAGFHITVDQARNAYVTGYTSSAETSFPVQVGPSTTFKGNTDAFVAKVKADGTGLVYAGFIGGSGDEAGFGIAVDRPCRIIR